MKYFLKLEMEDQLYLLNHPNGYKCWQTDYCLLRTRDNDNALLNFLDDKAIQEANKTHCSNNQE